MSNEHPFDSEPTTKEAWERFWGFISDTSNGNGIIALATCMMLITTIVYTVYSAKQWATAQASLQEFSKQTVIDQRAWLGLQGIDGIPEVGKKLLVTTHYINTGKTPALHVRRQAKWLESKREDGFRPFWNELSIEADFEDATSYSVSDLVPNLTMTQHIADIRGSDYRISQSEYNAIAQGDVVLYVYGRVCYDDIFQKQHWITFCQFYNPQNRSYSSCRDYNESDNGQNATKETCPLASELH